MEQKPCKSCNNIVSFNSYFSAYICDKCDYREEIPREVFADGYKELNDKIDKFYKDLSETLDEFKEVLTDTWRINKWSREEDK